MTDFHSTVSFKTIGCRLNQAETARLRGMFELAGYRAVRFGEPCDVCGVHGCAVTARAFKDTRLALGSVSRIKPRPFIVAAGCAAVFCADGIIRDKLADMVAGQVDKFQLPALLAGRGFPKPPGDFSRSLPIMDRTRAIIEAQNGCDFHCAYCVVPSLRGKPRSRPAADIIHEIRSLADQGCREFILTGANLGCYCHNGAGLLCVMKQIEKVPGVARVRLSSIEISTVEREVADFMADSGVFCRYLHVPLQSGDDRVLSLMGRRYTRREFQKTVEYFVKKIGLFGLGTDLIAGFPGEDDAAFENTFRLARELPFTRFHVFAFSPRPGPRAAGMSGRVPNHIVSERAARLRQLGLEREESFVRSLIGKHVSVLIEGSRPAKGWGRGWTREYAQARVEAAAGLRNRVFDFVPERAEGVCLIAPSAPLFQKD